MNTFKNHQELNADQIREIIGSKELTGVEGGDYVTCTASDILDEDIGEIEVMGSYDCFDKSTSMFLHFGGVSLILGKCENVEFDIYTLID
jgi:hypothetical protein